MCMGIHSGCLQGYLFTGSVCCHVQGYLFIGSVCCHVNRSLLSCAWVFNRSVSCHMRWYSMGVFAVMCIAIQWECLLSHARVLNHRECLLWRTRVFTGSASFGGICCHTQDIYSLGVLVMTYSPGVFAVMYKGVDWECLPWCTRVFTGSVVRYTRVFAGSVVRYTRIFAGSVLWRTRVLLTGKLLWCIKVFTGSVCCDVQAYCPPFCFQKPVTEWSRAKT